MKVLDQAFARLQLDDPEHHLRNAIAGWPLDAILVDRTFWLLAAADIINDQPAKLHRDLLRLAARRIHANLRAKHPDRLAATRFLFAKVLPIH